MAILKFKNRSVIDQIHDPLYLQFAIDWLISFFKRTKPKTDQDYVDELNAENRAREFRLGIRKRKYDYFTDRKLPPVHHFCRER